MLSYKNVCIEQPGQISHKIPNPMDDVKLYCDCCGREIKKMIRMFGRVIDRDKSTMTKYGKYSEKGYVDVCVKCKSCFLANTERMIIDFHKGEYDIQAVLFARDLYCGRNAIYEKKECEMSFIVKDVVKMS